LLLSLILLSAASVDLNTILLGVLLFELIVYLMLTGAIWSHLLILLLILEFLALKVLFIVLVVIRAAGLSQFVFLYVTLSVAEARLAIALLTTIMRTHGSDRLYVR